MKQTLRLPDPVASFHYHPAVIKEGTVRKAVEKNTNKFLQNLPHDDTISPGCNSRLSCLLNSKVGSGY